jgi:hypothetical protein
MPGFSVLKRLYWKEGHIAYSKVVLRALIGKKYLSSPS